MSASFEERLLDLARTRAAAAEVYSLATEEAPVQFEANRLKSLVTRESFGVALRIIQDGRMGFAAGMGPPDPEFLVQSALETAEFGAPARFTLPGPAPYAPVETYDPAIEAVAVEAMAAVGQQAIDQVRAAFPEVQCDATVARRVIRATVVNSAGVHAASRTSVFSARISGTWVRGTDMLFVGDSRASCRPGLDLSPIVEATLQQLEWCRATVPAPAMGAPVVFTPRAFAQAFTPALSLGFSGKTVLQGTSPLGELVGQACFDPRLTLVDDPTIAYCPGAQAFDGEGVTSQRRVLVDHGVLQGFVYDLQTAGLAGKGSTGNAGRGLTSLPAPDINVLVVEPGDLTFAAMLAQVDDGLVVEEMLGSSQGNVLGGDFSGNVLLGYRVRGGRIVGRVKDTMVAGNVYRSLRALQAVGRETLWVGGSLLLPAICCADIAISAAGR